MGRVDEGHLPLTPTSRLQTRLQLLFPEGGRLPGVLLDRLLGRDGDRPGLAPAQPQPILEEAANLAEAPADTGLLLDDGLGLFRGTRWVLGEVLLQRGLVIGQGTVGLVPAAAAEAVQAPSR
jgi:hypothetical protein